MHTDRQADRRTDRYVLSFCNKYSNYIPETHMGLLVKDQLEIYPQNFGFLRFQNEKQ